MVALRVKLATKHISRGHCVALHSTCVYAEDRSACKAKHYVFIEVALYQFLHLAKLRAVTLVEDEHKRFIKHFLFYFFLSQQGGHLLYGGDYYLRFLFLAQLFQQYSAVCIAVGAVGAESVVFLHRLVVEVLTVYDEHHLVNAVNL